MIYFYSGTPGSGKSLHVAIDIFRKLRFKKNVIATFPINISMVSNKGKRKIGNFVYKDVSELTVQFLFDCACLFK